MGAKSPVVAVLELLARLHRHKDAAYGDAWRKRGEVIAIFANLARKYDRLIIGMAESEPASTDPLADTIGDLCVYAGKYLTWLAETQPDAFAAWLPIIDPSVASAQRGPAALEAVFAALPGWEAHSGVGAPRDAAEAWSRVSNVFQELEAGLMAQSDPNAAADLRLTWPRKVELAWALTDATAWMLARLAEQEPARLNGLRAEVAAMDERRST